MNNNKNIKRLKFFLADKQRKNVFIILYEVLILTLIKKGFPFYYFGRLVYRKKSGNFKDYLSTKEYYKIINSKNLNSEVFNNIMGNKLFFSLFCEKNDLPNSNLWCYNFKNTFYYKETSSQINTINELIIFFRTVFKNSKKEALFLKPFESKGGKGIFLLKFTELENQLNQFGEALLKNFYIYEDVIEQHAEINKIYPNSINTLRIITYIDAKDNFHFLETSMRFGLGGGYVDNVSSGGFEVSTDMPTGTLHERGYQELEFGGQVFFHKHPDTGCYFFNFKIPYYKEAHDLCLKLASQLPNRLTGWDIAITPNGPIIVEANANPDITIGENHYKGYLKHPLYKLIISEI